VHEFAPDPATAPAGRAVRPSYGLEAAAALGADPARVPRKLIASVDGRLVAAIVPVDRELDLEALAAAVA